MAVKVAFVISGLGLGGAESQLLTLCANFNRDRVSPVILSMAARSDLESAFINAKVPVFRCGGSVMKYNPAMPLALAWRVWRLKPDVLQGWMYHGNVLASLLPKRVTNNAPVLWNIRGMGAMRASNTASARAIFEASKALKATPRWIVNNSEISALAHEAACDFPPPKRLVIPNGFDTSLLHPSPALKSWLRVQLGLAKSDFLVGFVGRDHPDKDVQNFISMSAILAQRAPQYHFIYCGTDLSHHNRMLVVSLQKNGVMGRSTLLGPVRPITKVIPGLDVLVSSSVTENFPNTIGEAMSCGVPCVATDVGDCALLVGDEKNIVGSKNPEALANAVQRIFDMPAELRISMGLEGRARIVDRFSLSYALKRYEDLYESLMESKCVE